VDRRPGGYSVVRNDSTPAKGADDDATVRSWRDGPRTPWAVMGLAITTFGGILTAYLMRPPVSLDCASRADMNAVQKQVSELEKTQSALVIAMGRNADVAHNETQGVVNRLDAIRDQLAIQGRTPFAERVSDALKK